MSGRIKQETITQRIMDLLSADLLTEAQLRQRIAERQAHSIHTSLTYLVQMKAVGFLADGTTTLFYATPDTDQRLRHAEEMAIPLAPRKRKSRAKLPATVNLAIEMDKLPPPEAL